MSGSVHCSFVALILVRYVLVQDTSYFYIYSIRPKRKSTVPCYHLIKHNIKPKKSHTTSQKDKKLTANFKFWSLITHRKNINCISIIKFSDLFFFTYRLFQATPFHLCLLLVIRSDSASNKEQTEAELRLEKGQRKLTFIRVNKAGKGKMHVIKSISIDLWLTKRLKVLYQRMAILLGWHFTKSNTKIDLRIAP